MEFKDVSEEVQWEARRVAVAFGLEHWKWQERKSIVGTCGNITYFFAFDRGAKLSVLSIGDGEPFSDACDVRCEEQLWHCQPEEAYDEIMARGLYRLGFEDEGVLSQLPTLIAHEKLELRLSLPREFWPQAWLDEETL